MRNCILLACLSAASITSGMLLRPAADTHSHRLPLPVEQVCVLDAADLDGSETIDDKEIRQHIQHTGGAMVDDSEATEMAELINQLRVGECDLALPQKTDPLPADGLLYEHAKKSVLVIAAIYKCGRCNNWHAGCASGFVVSASGAIVTNYHVVDKPTNSTLVAMTADGQVLPVKRVLAASKANDIAILQLDVEDHVLTPLPIARERMPVGSNVSVISHPNHHYYCYTSGVVSRYTQMRSNEGRADAMTITADFARGSSGAPVLNDKGEVIGIVRSTESLYYKVEKGQQKNLQMVFKTCIPSTSLLKLIARNPDTVSRAE
ncbi:MAG: serine protease [Pirellulales bacterium]|nr:serine protease [Pirellulales bacterium]